MSELSANAFDELAADYDASFTASVVGTRVRQAVWRRLDACFMPGERILELGCGTGEDALYLAHHGADVLALDRSAAMVSQAQDKVERAGMAHRVTLRHASIEDWAAETCSPASQEHAARPVFDGALSNFGALNCVDDLRPVAVALAAAIRPGGRVVLVLMGPWVPWEWGWYLARGRPGPAFRRLRTAGVDWRGIRVRYPRIKTLRQTFASGFRLRRSCAIGALVPPSYAEAWAARHPRLTGWLDRLERRVESWPPWPSLADHYLAELERR